ncbi:MAG: Crp/Fnr family transcriptional regulator [Pyrinomonadaceae bacterium]
MTATAKPYAVKNRLLAALPHEEYDRLQPHLELVHLSTRKTLSEAGDLIEHTYFLNSGMGSLLALTQDGATIEIAMVGNEGMLGIPVVLGAHKTSYRIMVQIPGDAMRIKADVIWAEFKRAGELQDLLLRYTHALITQISQSAVCNRFHTVEKRLCRWLLTAHDRVDGNTFHLTQEIISYMMGTPRTGVTMAASTLQDEGLIRYKRGKITIIDRSGLEEAACECYRIVAETLEHFLTARN